MQQNNETETLPKVKGSQISTISQSNWSAQQHWELKTTNILTPWNSLMEIFQKYDQCNLLEDN